MTQSRKAYPVQGATRVDVACNNIVPIQAVLFAKSLFEEYGGLMNRWTCLKTGTCGCVMPVCSSL